MEQNQDHLAAASKGSGGGAGHVLKYGGKFDYMPWSATSGYRHCSCGNWHFEHDVDAVAPAVVRSAAASPEGTAE